ncbi:MAG TPA: hypothetical protein VKX17_01720 [Planctomycetota bacterium]|nr:hypothetical protein [Planctomycetota bacterium]
MADEPVRPHSKIGKLSTLLGALALLMVTGSVAAVVLSSSEKKIDALSVAGGVGMLIALGVSGAGALLSLASLLFSSRKVFGVIGLILNGAIILAYLVLTFGVPLFR